MKDAVMPSVKPQELTPISASRLGVLVALWIEPQIACASEGLVRQSGAGFGADLTVLPAYPKVNGPSARVESC